MTSDDEPLPQPLELIADLLPLVTTAIALSHNRDIAARLRAMASLADGQMLYLEIARSRAWLEIGGGTNLTLLRLKPAGMPSLDFNRVLAVDTSFDAFLAKGIADNSYERKALALLQPIIDRNAFPSRLQMKRLLQFAPLIEGAAYRCATRLSGLLDLIRRRIASNRQENSTDHIMLYWSLSHTMAHLMFLSSSREAAPLLRAVAEQIDDYAWTPTFPLLRERTLWLASCAARSAVAFGAPIIAKYLNVLEMAQHPLAVFDALFGLSAIVFDRPSEAPAVLNETVTLARLFENRDDAVARLSTLAFHDAIDLMSGSPKSAYLEQDDFRRLQWFALSRHGLATPQALTADPTTISHSGGFLGFAGLSRMLESLPLDFYPLAKLSNKLIRNGAVKAFSRAWSTLPINQNGSVH